MMKSNDVKKLAEKGVWRGKPLHGKLVETHISWIILAEDLVFKIKKPESFNFLDFSTLEKRKYYCEKEVILNSRFSDIYLDVVPVYQQDDQFFLGGKNSDPVDFAVRMKKIAPEKEMSRMLESESVSHTHIEKLARTLAKFHRKAEVIKKPFDIGKMKEDFNDLDSVKSTIAENLGEEEAATCTNAIDYSNHFLELHQSFIEQRSEKGYRRDLHGDFHSGNIFLTEEPIIFDCIEFNDEMRQIDILDEIAFFCMDMDAHGRTDLGQQFLQTYQAAIDIEFSEKEMKLFNYFKLYRANVRTKVNSLNKPFKASMVRPYLQLMEGYLRSAGN